MENGLSYVNLAKVDVAKQEWMFIEPVSMYHGNASAASVTTVHMISGLLYASGTVSHISSSLLI